MMINYFFFLLFLGINLPRINLEEDEFEEIVQLPIYDGLVEVAQAPQDVERPGSPLTEEEEAAPFLFLERVRPRMRECRVILESMKA